MEIFDLSGNPIPEQPAPRRNVQHSAPRRQPVRNRQPAPQMRQNTQRRANVQARQGNAQVRQNSVQAQARRRNTPAKPKKKSIFDFSIPQKFDFSFFMIVVILLAFGLIMLFSASYAAAKDQYDNSFYYINRQLIFAAIGFGAMIAISFIDYHLYANRAILNIAVMVSVGLMLLVPIMGITSGGAERWIEIFGIQFQPSEILKIITIIVIAEYMQRNYDKRGDFWHGFVPLMVRVVISCLLVIMQPHLSCTVIILVTSICMLTIGGTKWSHLALIGAALVVGALLVVKVFPALGFDYVTARLLSWENPEADIQGDTYQTFQSLVTIGSGGMFGLGLGNSRQKYGFLPVTQNDFIFSVICEELGFVGAVAVILLFVVFLFRGLYIASAAPDKFGMLLCAGIVIHLTIQAFLNIAVVSNAIPNTGISLPFISYGGTALCLQLAEMGVVLNISRKAAMD